MVRNQVPMLYIIITDFNGYKQTKKCLAALKASTYRNFKTIVVDHGTTHDTSKGLNTHFPDVIVLKGSESLWWTGAVNLGIRYALSHGAERIMLLNNDCYVTPDAVEILMQYSRQCAKSIVAPIQRDWKTGKINVITPCSHFLFGFPTWPGKRKLTREMKKNGLINSKLIIGGRGVVIPVELFSSIGLFDENTLPHYGADHDFYLKARKKGVDLMIAAWAFVDVDNSRTTMADNPGMLTFKEFINSFYSIRSHRNIKHVKALFRKQYPIPGMYLLGVALYLGRYCFVYFIKRFFFIRQSKA
jgi:GT2 family glycosyltransferase